MLRLAALRCAVLPVPRAARERIIDELEEEYPGIVARRGNVAAAWWYARELTSVFAWYLLQRLPRRRPLGTPNHRAGSLPMNRSAPVPSSRDRLVVAFGNLARDIRGALRGMRNSLGFTALAVAVLAVGIGASTAVFSVFDWVLLRAAPGVTAPEQLVTLRFGDGNAIYTMGNPLYLDLRARSETLSGLAAHTKISAHVALRGVDRTERVAAEVVSDNYFDILGVSMAVGRGFRADEGTPETPARVVVISARLQSQWFAGEQAVGRELLLSGTPFEVIGVAPPGFHGAEHPGESDLWFTLASHDASMPQWNDVFSRTGGVWMSMLGRLRAGATLEAAHQELSALAAQIADEYGDDGGGFRRFAVQLTPGTDTFGLRQRAVTTLRIMSTVVAILLLLTCANVANMVLARVTGRRGEIAVRRTLGATRTRLVGQLLVESSVLAALGGLAAVAVSFGMVRMFEGSRIVSWMPALHDVPVDLRVLGFALATSLLTGVACGLVPALSASRPSTMRGGASSGGRLRDGLVVVQLALSVALFVGAALLARTLGNMRAIDVGIERNHLVFFSVDPGLQGYDEARSRALVRRIVDNLEALPGVRSVSAGFPEAFGRIRAQTTVAPWGEDLEENGVDADNAQVTPRYFETMGIDLVAGSTFDADVLVDKDPARRQLIVSEGLAHKLFPDGAVVGRRLTLQEYGRDEPVPYEIVGVARDAHLRRLLDDEVDIVYEPFGQRYFPQNISFQVRSASPAAATLGPVRDAMLAADATLPAFNVVTAVDQIDGTIAEHRLVARLSTALAVTALLLAGIGIYGVVGTAVRMRFHEIGVRMALGARGRDVLGGVLRRSLTLGLAGVTLGLLGAVQVAGLLRARLYGVDPFDPAIFVAGALIVLALALLASLVPARRATRVNPVEVLRGD
jgi:predicted permease